MMQSPSVILTIDQVSDWRRRKSELEQTILQAQQELALINRRLDAVAILTEDGDEIAPVVERASGGETMMSAVMRITRSADGPLTKADLRQRLEHDGFPDERLGAYFYTVIARLKKKGKISVLDDGRVSATNRNRLLIE